jgi:hypothetical protein
MSEVALSKRTFGVLKKVMITAVAGGVALAVQIAAKQDPALSIVLSVVIGGVSLIVQFLLEFENRLAQLEDAQAVHARSVDEKLNATFVTVNEATELFNLLEKSAVQAQLVTQLVRNSTLIKPGSPPLLYSLAQQELSRTSRFLKELGDGTVVTYDGEDRDWLLALAACVEETVDAISMTTVDAGAGFDRGLWSTDLGKRYLNAQSEAVQERGVKIRRLLVLDQETELDSASLRQLCQRHLEAGIEVRLIEPRKVPVSLQTELFDYAIFDKSISYQLSSGTWTTEDGSPIIVGTRLILQEDELERRIKNFEKLWRLSGPAPGADPGDAERRRKADRLPQQVPAPPDH